MLKVITLHTIKQIFDTEALSKCTGTAKMLYINCLTHYFEAKTPSIANSVAFDLKKGNIPQYDYFKPLFEELAESGLICINADSVTFLNHWHKHIDKTQMDRVSPEEYLGLLQYKPAADYKQELLENGSMFDLIGMRQKLNRTQIVNLINEFIQEQTTLKKSYNGISDCAKHCIYWMAKKKGEPSGIIKSKGKMLGD